jgi:AraC-like DNA-binding protein
MGLPAIEVVDQQVAAELVWAEVAVQLAEKLLDSTPPARLAHLERFVATCPGEVDPLVSAAAHLLGGCGDQVSRVADQLGVSTRQLHRRTTMAVGYGPKMLARVMRARRLHRVTATSLAELAYKAGYASQAHMGDDVRSLTGMTPVRFLEYLGRSDALT